MMHRFGGPEISTMVLLPALSVCAIQFPYITHEDAVEAQNLPLLQPESPFLSPDNSTSYS